MTMTIMWLEADTDRRMGIVKKIVSAQAAAAMIPDGASIWLSAGGGGINEPSFF